jgi:endonuclease/exonuclease/phosphatase family metal-dependent hydrolase
MNATAPHVHRHLFERGSGFFSRSLLVVCLTVLSLSWSLDEPVLAQDTTPSTPALKNADESVPVEIRFGRAVPLPKGPKTIRIAAYNVLNLFDPVDDPTLSGKYDDLPMATSRDRCLAIAKVIKAIDADVLALEEVESKEAIEWFRDEFLQGLGYDHVASLDVGYYRGVEQSVLSRFPISGVTAWPDESLADMEAKKTGDGWETKGDAPKSFQRSPLMVDIEVPESSDHPAYSFTLAVVHHKSGNFKRQRESEALQLVELLQSRLEEEPELNLIILGDFNAGPFDQSVAVYKNAGFVNAYEHRWSREEGTRNLFRTHESDRVIDYIMLHPNADSEVAKNTFQVVGSLHPGDKYNWRKDEPPSGYAADHYPLVIDLVPQEGRVRTGATGR